MRHFIEMAAAIATIVGVVIAVVALWVAYVEFNEAKQADRVNATLSYVTRYKSDPLMTMTQRFNALLDGTDAKNLIANHGDAATWQKNTAVITKKYNLEPVVVTLSDFFDELYICYNTRICDFNLGLMLVGDDDIQTFYVWNMGLLAELNKSGYPRLGCGLVALYNAEKPKLAAQRAGQSASVTPVSLDKNACPAVGS